jgi:N-acetylneuraminic acid mutarotase
VDTSAQPGQTVHYRVVAVDRAGNVSAPTDAAYTVPGTPLANPFAWRALAPSPVPRFEASGAGVGGRLFVFGGFVTTDIRSTARSDVFDPAANAWTRIADMPVQLTHNATVADGTSIWSVGGFVGNHPGASTTDVWRYDTAANRWTRGPSLPARRGAGAVARVGRTLFFFGGVDRPAGQEHVVDDAEHWALDLDRLDLGWRPRADLPVPRNHLAAGTLGGRVYAIGGQFGADETNGNRPEVHRYDPVANTWARVADMPVPRGHTTASAFPVDGRLVVVGGTQPGSQPSSEVSEYDPVTNVWVKLPGLPSGRKTPVADLLGGSIVSATGNSGGTTPTTTTWAGELAGRWETGPPLPASLGELAGGILGKELVLVGESNASTYAYDLSKGTWRTLPTRPYVGHHHAAEVLGGKLHLFGGLHAGAGKTQVYDPATGRWSVAADMPFATGSASSAVIGGRAYVAGGIVGSSTTNRVARYDPTTNTWTEVAAMPQGRNHAAAATDGTRLWVFGGRGPGSGDANSVANGFDTVQAYDPATNRWTSSASGGGHAPLPQARGGMGRAAYVDGEFYVLGGETASGGGGATADGVYRRVDVFDPFANRWRTGPAMPTARHGIFPLQIADRIYVAGGGTKAGFSASNVLEVLNAGR